MAAKMQNEREHELGNDNVIAFSPVALTAGYWTAAAQFGPLTVRGNANENYAPLNCDGAQTSDQMLEFLYGVAQ